MFGLIFRLREPLSEQGRADFARATVLSCIVGVVRGISLIAFIPAALALTSGHSAWGDASERVARGAGWVRAHLICRRVSPRYAFILGGL